MKLRGLETNSHFPLYPLSFWLTSMPIIVWGVFSTKKIVRFILVLIMAGTLWRYQLKALFKGIKYVYETILVWVNGGPNSDLELGLYFSKLLLKLTILGTRKSVKKFRLKYGYSTTTTQNELKYSVCLACKMGWADPKNKVYPNFFSI